MPMAVSITFTFVQSGCVTVTVRVRTAQFAHGLHTFGQGYSVGERALHFIEDLRKELWQRAGELGADDGDMVYVRADILPKRVFDLELLISG